jgi:uncharacterized protein with FMN-binding domain
VSSKPAAGSNGPNKRATANLVALGSIAVLGVYTVGYVRTEAAAQRFAAAAEIRRPTAVIPRTPEGELSSPALPSVDSAAPEALQSATRDKTRAPMEDTTSNAGAKSVAPAASSAASKAGVKAATVATKSSATAIKDSMPATAPGPATNIAVVPPTVDSAKTPVPPVVSAATADSTAKEPVKQRAQWQDGAYIGYGTSRHGDIEATIEIRGGRIVSASISQCRTQYSCSWISALPPQVIARQSAEIDYVSGATQSSNALYGAIVDALNKAK